MNETKLETTLNFNSQTKDEKIHDAFPITYAAFFR